MEAKQTERKESLYRKGKKMLKDIDFLVERKLEEMDTRDDDWLEAHTDAHHFHTAKDKILADKIGGISRGDVYLGRRLYSYLLFHPPTVVILLCNANFCYCAEKCYEIEIVHRAMLKDLFCSMDDDGSGMLEEPEIKKLAIALGQKLSHNEAVAGMSVVIGSLFGAWCPSSPFCGLFCCACPRLTTGGYWLIGDSYARDGR